jgi:Flp pilus assembly protein TadG
MNLIRRRSYSFVQDKSGTAAIEFALVAVPFIMIVVAILELSVMFAANSIMLGATQDAVRAVRTGQVQVISDPDEAEDFFREQICNHIPIKLVDCNAIQFTVEVLDAFSEANTTAEVDDDGDLASDDIDFGDAEDVVMVRVLYYHPMLTPLMGAILSDSPGNRKLMTATFVFQTEPYLLDDDVI